MNTLNEGIVADKLARLHKLAAEQRTDNPDIYKLSAADRFMAVSPELGQFLNFIATLTKAKNIVEFGCSFGISGIYLAAAAKENSGSVITTEMEESKALSARVNFEETQLADYIEVRIGDALQTLKNVEHIDFLFLDGAKELYKPVYDMLYPTLSANAVIIADNIDKPQTQNLVNHLKESNEYKTVSLFNDRMLISYREG